MSELKDLAILYVEDDPLSRQAMEILIARVLKVEKFYLFEDSVDFMDRLKKLPKTPDLILLDIHMKPHSGFELLELLRGHKDYAECKVIAFTASVMNEEVALLRESGFNGVIGKPIDINTLPDLLSRIAAGESIWHITN